MSQLFKFGPQLRELRIHLCQTGAASKGVREFIEKYYVQIKAGNPKFPILIRECSGVQPRIWARYRNGMENSLPVANQKADEVLQQFKNLATK